MANEENLKPFNEMSSEDAKKIQVKGGKKRAEIARKRKSYKEIFDILQSNPIKKDKTISIQKEINGDIVSMDVNLINYLKDKYSNLLEEEINNATFASIKIIELIDHPDARVAIKAFEVVRDTVGEKPVDKQDIAHSGTVVANYSVSPATEAAALKAKQQRDKIDE